jgi:type II secretory pathway pseudopilin PulG
MSLNNFSMIQNLLFKRRGVRGDTIIEVVMSIAIAAAVIAGAYALSNRSLAEGISASQHSQAIKLAQTQIEALKSRQRDATNDTGPWNSNYNFLGSVPANKNNFCLDTSATAMKDPTGTVLANWLPQYNGNEYSPVCTDTGVAATAKFFINVKVMTYSTIPLRKPTYSITVRWESVDGGPYSQSQLYYRF